MRKKISMDPMGPRYHHGAISGPTCI